MCALNVDRELIAAFLQDADSFLSNADGHFAALDLNPADEEAVRELFRITHSLKGNAGYMGLEKMKVLSHTLENLLLQLRDKPGAYNKTAGDALRAGVDELKNMSARLKAGEDEVTDENAYSDILAALDLVANQIKISDVAGLWTSLTADFNTFLEKFSSEDPVLMDLVSRMMFAIGSLDPYLKGEKKEKRQPVDTAPKQLEEKKTAAAPSGPATVDSKMLKALTQIAEGFERSQQELDRSMDTAPQLRTQNAALYVDLRALSENHAELVTRFKKALAGEDIPLSRLLDRIPLIVSDVSSKSGKKVQTVCPKGLKLELPRRIYELLESPIVHLVRNSVDHGIELPEKRVEAGKPETGTVTITAQAGEGMLEITVSDDGRGIDTSAVKWKAVSKGMLDAAKASTISDEEVYQLLFLPGFSTAEVVTDISGRGVGMDVVKSNIEEQLGGKICITSEPGKGSTFTLALPFEAAPEEPAV
ncbi:MAG TPA: ATP-binding protein [Elusimicrobiales bacterium]|nr:ATP-binding protein [Elusimicrobiales bacterium]